MTAFEDPLYLLLVTIKNMQNKKGAITQFSFSFFEGG